MDSCIACNYSVSSSRLSVRYTKDTRVQTLARASIPRFFEFVRFALAVTQAISLLPDDIGGLTRMPLCNFSQAAKLRAVGGNQHILPSFSVFYIFHNVLSLIVLIKC